METVQLIPTAEPGHREEAEHQQMTAAEIAAAYIEQRSQGDAEVLVVVSQRHPAPQLPVIT